MRQCVWKEKEIDFNWWNPKRLLKMREREVERGENPLKENVIDNTEGYYCPNPICLAS